MRLFFVLVFITIVAHAIVAQEKLNQYPNEVVLLTVGPVTNMLDVVRRDPESLKKAKGICSMFGSFYMGYDGGPVSSAEWNVRADEEASIAFTSSGAPIRCAGLDITLVQLREKERRALQGYDTPLTNALADLYPLWRTQPYAADEPTLFDVVAVAMVLWPDLFSYRPAYVKVIEGGYTVIDESKSPNDLVGKSVDLSTLIFRLMDRLLRQQLGVE